MPTVTILHRGLRANDTLLEYGCGVFILTYYTRNRLEGITSDRVGCKLYKNQKVFKDKEKAMLWYFIDEPKRFKKLNLPTDMEVR